MRRLLPALLFVAAAVPAPSPAGAAVPVLVIEGKGFGHGVGMAQDGAFWMGRGGASTAQILSQFYPGTSLGKQGGTVRVPVLEGAGGATVLSFPDGGEVLDARGGAQSPGFPINVPSGGQVRFRMDGGRYRADLQPGGRALPAPPSPAAGGGERVELASTRPVAAAVGAAQEPTTTTTVPSGLLPSLLPPLIAPILPPPTTTTTAPPEDGSGADGDGDGTNGGGRSGASSTRTLWAVPAGGGAIGVVDRNRRYRGAIEIGGGGGLRLVNELDVEQYLRGMGEVRDPSWPPASLRAQAIAARTYALRAMAASGEICETTRCQVYLGADAEYRAMNSAVEQSRGQVILFGTGLASAVYSSNGGGFSATSEEGFGTPSGGAPYLRAAPYPTQEPSAWTVRVALSDVGRRFGYRGGVSDVKIGRVGPSGRALEVTIDGASGPRAVPGIAFDAGLGLRSTLFTLHTEEAATAPPPPAAEDLVQAPPDALGDGGAPPAEGGGGEQATLAAATVPSVLDTGRAGRPVALGPSLFALVLLIRVGQALTAERSGRGAGRPARGDAGR